MNIIADLSWGERRFDVIREWALSVPEIVHVTVSTPYPGTEIWLTESRELTTRDYRLFESSTRCCRPRFRSSAFTRSCSRPKAS